MNQGGEAQGARVAGFRRRLLVATMIVVTTVTLLGLWFGERRLARAVEEDLRREFQAELAVLRNAREMRHAGLVERCRSLVRRSRIQSALEDDALDLLYPSAVNELRDLVEPSAGAVAGGAAAPGLSARFYRFLGPGGAVIPGSNPRDAGALSPAEEARLTLPSLPSKPQVGYLTRDVEGGEAQVFEVIATPILSTDTGEPIAALVLGFDAPGAGRRDATGMKSGVHVDGRLHSNSLPAAEEAMLAGEIRGQGGGPVRVNLAGGAHLLFAQRLNPDSLYPAALEVCAFPLADLEVRQGRLRWQVLGAGVLLLLVGLGGSHVVSARFAAPVERLAFASEENRAQRARVEAALEMTSAELQRSARFSADASHQLKTPVAVLRAGLEELLANDNLTPEECAAISALIHQTYRLSSLIEDLLLLSRMDAGRLKLSFAPVNLSALIEASLDDLGAAPDGRSVRVETDFPPDLHVAGEKRYTAIILQNLLENARKYNVRDGRIRIAAAVEGDAVRLVIGNTGRPIAAAAQSHIFERFHRGSVAEDVPGYGLGLNLARELARQHLGDLQLLRSDENWTEFEVSFRRAAAPTP